MNSLADFLWAMLAFYFLFMCIWIFIRIFADIFRRDDLSGGRKVLWIFVLFVLPFFGAMVYIFTRPKGTGDAEVFGTASATGPQPGAQPQPSTTSASTADEVAKLAALRDSGAITSAEFDAAKAKALAA